MPFPDLVGTHAGRRATSLAAAISLLTVLVTAGAASAAPSRPDASSSASIEGRLSILHGDDPAAGFVAGHRYFLSSSTGDIELAFAGSEPEHWLNGATVRVDGTHRGRVFLVAAGGTHQVKAASSGSTSPATGSRRLAVVLLNFSNDPSEPYTRAFADGVAFSNADSVAAYYRASSWGQLSVGGDVFGWFTIPSQNIGCAVSDWASEATSAAAASGVDLGSYDNVVFAFPYAASCAWTGMATMPGQSSWLNGAGGMTLQAMAHELGHNLGTHHASSLRCTDGGMTVALSTACTRAEYGDPFTVMGSSTRFEHSSYARGNLGWLASSQTVTVTKSGDYVLAPLESPDGSSVQALRVERADEGTYLSLEYRQPGALFDTFSAMDPVVNGVTVRVTAPYSSLARSALVDTSPATATFSDAPLGLGRTLFDPVSGAAITVLATSSSGATVRVVLGGTAPTPAPTPSAEPSTSPTPTPTQSPAPTPSATPTSTPAPTAAPDALAPTAPSGLVATLAKGRKAQLVWDASADNVGVAGYRLFRNGQYVATTSEEAFTDSVARRSGNVAYYVVAFDAAGNTSAPSAQVVLTP